MMRRPAWIVVAVIATAGGLAPIAHAGDGATAARPRDIAGRYRSSGDMTRTVTLTLLAPGIYRAAADGWEGAGLFDGKGYWGVFRSGREGRSEASGTHQGTLRPDGSLLVRSRLDGDRSKPIELVWTPEPAGEGDRGLPVPTFEHPVWPRESPPGGEELPAPGDYVYVEELPEALTKVPPVYPEAARRAGVEGTVLVQALVGKDGRVRDAKIARSVSGLDEAALEAVRRWVFKPAMAKGEPVAVWVVTPVKFSLR